jgi:hypothetical protein
VAPRRTPTIEVGGFEATLTAIAEEFDDEDFSATMTALAEEFGDEDFSATMTAIAEEFGDEDFAATMTAIAEEFGDEDFSATMTAIAVEFEDLFNPATQTALAEQFDDFFNPATQTALAEEFGIEIPTIGIPEVPVPVPFETPTPGGGAPREPERMSLTDFKILYDDPQTRPIILDVRSEASFQEGHITGAISFPLANLATRVGELPKDKLIVAYCQ